MSQADEKERVTRRVSFLEEEDQLIQARAKEVGMSVSAYIRQQALEGKVVSVDWDLVRQHMEAIYRIEFSIDAYTSKNNPTLWLFGADLQVIRDELVRIKELEKWMINLLTGDR